MNEATPIRHAVDLNQIEDRIRETPAKTFADHADDTAHGIAKLLVAMDEADSALKLIETAAAAILEKAKPARALIEAVRASAQR